MQYANRRTWRHSCPSPAKLKRIRGGPTVRNGPRTRAHAAFLQHSEEKKEVSLAARRHFREYLAWLCASTPTRYIAA
jgi:hypothetical protein